MQAIKIPEEGDVAITTSGMLSLEHVRLLVLTVKSISNSRLQPILNVSSTVVRDTATVSFTLGLLVPMFVRLWIRVGLAGWPCMMHPFSV